MSSVLYFAKINVASHVQQMYKSGHEKREEILNLIIKNINNELECDREAKYSVEGEEETYNANYKFKYIQKDGKVVIGNVIKNAPVKVRKLDERTGNIYVNAEENFELIQFYYDVSKEIVTFYRTQRFGYKEFVTAFEMLLNKAMENEEDDYEIEVELLREGLNIDKIKEELKKLGKIKDLKITINPPNPNEEQLDSALKRGEEELEEFKKANITSSSVLFETKDKDGINIDSPMVEKEIERTNYIHSKMKSEEATSKGDAKIEASNINGRSFSTEKSDPIKDSITASQKDDFGEFIEVCQKKIASVISSFL
jgi:hypothetical protein